jgi:hypothetical protein
VLANGFTAGATVLVAAEGEDPEIGIIAKISYFLDMSKNGSEKEAKVNQRYYLILA